MIPTRCFQGLAASLLLLSFASTRLMAQPVTVDAGSTHVFAVSSPATNWFWTLNGVPVGGNSNAFRYLPQLHDVGVHHVVVDQTLPGGEVSNHSFAVRVRLNLPAAALNYYVATNGSDAAAGTSSNAPFRTLEKARDAIRALSRPLPAGGVTVWLRGGTHYRTSTLLLNHSNDSGTATAPIVYRSYPGETAVVSGGKPLAAGSFVPLHSSQTNRVPPGTDPASIVELDVSAAGITRASVFPTEFGAWITFNTYSPNTDGGLCELLYNGQRMYLSRYPNRDPLNDDLNTTNLWMDGVAAGRVASSNSLVYAEDSIFSLNYPGTYTNSSGVAVAVGGAFHFPAQETARLARWQSALTNGGLWLQGYWRVPWQVDGLKVKALDLPNRVVMFESGASPQNGIGDKYTRPVGSQAEPFWAVNLLEELDQPGEWAVDFQRNKIYFHPPGPITDGSVVISDFGSPLIQIAGRSNIVFHTLTFEAGLAQGIYITNGLHNLVLGCTLRTMGNHPVEFFNGGSNGVVSCDLINLAGGGVLLRGGTESTNSAARVAARHFVVNNLITNFSRVTRVYAAAVDAGFFGAGTGNGGGGHVASVGMRVANNRIRVSPHAAVLHGSWDSTFEFNRISEFQQVSVDLGAFYSYDFLNRHGNQTFRYNFIHDSPYGNGIDFDQDGFQMPIYGNVMNLNTVPGSPQGYGVIYHDYNQGVKGQEQAITCSNNLFANTQIGGVFVAPVPSVIQENAAIVCDVDFTWRQVIPGTSSNAIVTSSAEVMQSGPNVGYGSDPGFLDLAGNDLRLVPDSPIYADMPAYKEIPFELIGLHNDEFRSGVPDLAPWVTHAGGATGVSSNAATLRGYLVFPWLNTNTWVRVFWGTHDGGVNPEHWQHSASFGFQARGALSTNLIGLMADRTYFYRYQASNATAVTWAGESQSFYTPSQPPAAPTGLTATPGVAQVMLHWAAVIGASSYHVKRSSSGGGPYLLLTNVTRTTFTDVNLYAGTNYYYVVSAVNLYGEGPDSVPVFAGPAPGAVKADNLVELDQGASWLGGSVPTGAPAVWDSTVTTNGTVSIGAGVSFSGLQIRNPGVGIVIEPGSGGSLTLGGEGIDLSTSARTLVLNAPVNLVSNQVWITGSSGGANATQLAVAGNVSGAGGLLLTNPVGRALSLAGSSNTFGGGFTLSEGARVIIAGNSNATGSGGAPRSSYLGVGPLTLNGGSIGNTTGFSLNQGLANPTITVNGDFTMGLSARMMMGGAWNLGGAVRNVTTMRAVSAANAIIAGGNTTWGLGTIATVPSSLSNGTLRVLRDPAASHPYVSFRLASNPSFFNNAGLTLGSGVLATVGNSDITNANTSRLMTLSLEAGAWLNLGEAAASRNVTVSSLSGAGSVANLNNTTTSGSYLATLTINGGALTSASEFAGRLLDTDTALNPGSMYGVLALTKSGHTTQILSGTNRYTGPTLLNGGALIVNGDHSLATGPVTVQSGAVLGGRGILGGTVTVSGSGRLEPGVEGAGRLTINGSLAMTNAVTLAVELGGTNQPGAFQIASASHDLVVVVGAAGLAGNLRVSLLNGFLPAPTDGFVILASSGLSGAFTNLVNGRVPVDNLLGASFLVTTNAGSLVLTDFDFIEARFSASVTNGFVPLPVSFTDLSVGAITNRSWDFGEGGSIHTTFTSVEHTFLTMGTNLVKLVVRGPSGASTNQLTVTVTAPPAPPVISQVLLQGTNLVFGGTNGTPGQTYAVLATTNLAPPAYWWPVATQQFGSDGAFAFTNAIPLGNRHEFFQLRVP